MTRTHKVVVVGGGIAGIEVATALGRRHGRHGRAEVTLVDRSWAHVWKPMLHAFAAGTARADRDRVPFLSQGARHGFRFAPGLLAGVDRGAGTIEVGEVRADDGTTLLPARTLDWDTLVVALGSRANDFGTPGVEAHCAFIDTVAEADRFNRRLREAALRAAANGDALAVAIVGGGATGVELAAELHRARDIAAGLEGAGRRDGGGTLDATLSRTRLAVTLLESGARLLAAFPERVSAAAEGQLRALGIDVRTGAKVVAADENGFTLADGTRVAAKLLVWAAGVKASAGIDVFADLERSRTGQLMVDPTLRTTRDARIFALGDCARMTENPAPPTAQAARQQAGHFVRAFDELRAGRPLPAYRYADRGAVVTVGPYNGWGTLGKYLVFGGGRLRGFTARAAHDLLYRQHQMELYGVPRGLAAWAADELDRLVRPAIRLD